MSALYTTILKRISFILAFVVVSSGQTIYRAFFGKYGMFEMEISADGSSMSWTTSLQNLNELVQEIGGSQELTLLNYHLHQQWTTLESDVGIGAEGCSSAVTMGHYDPFFGCGPATGVPLEQCLAIGRPPEAYQCSPEMYSAGNYSTCEVGDLSGKYGPLIVSDTALANDTVVGDPLAAKAAHYESERRNATADRFASIVLHDGSPRVLCGKLYRIDDKDDDTIMIIPTIFPSTSPVALSTSSPTPSPTFLVTLLPVTPLTVLPMSSPPVIPPTSFPTIISPPMSPPTLSPTPPPIFVLLPQPTSTLDSDSSPTMSSQAKFGISLVLPALLLVAGSFVVSI